MATGKTTLRLYKALYWLVMVCAVLYLCYIMFITGRTILGVMWLVTGLILTFIFYFYYFSATVDDSQWPPYISPCPDYLTRVEGVGCVDYVGLHSRQLQKSDPSLKPPSPKDSGHVFPVTGVMSVDAATAGQYGLTWEGVV